MKWCGKTISDATIRALVESLPRCYACKRIATYKSDIFSPHTCDEHCQEGQIELPYAFGARLLSKEMGNP